MTIIVCCWRCVHISWRSWELWSSWWAKSDITNLGSTPGRISRYPGNHQDGWQTSHIPVFSPRCVNSSDQISHCFLWDMYGYVGCFYFVLNFCKCQRLSREIKPYLCQRKTVVFHMFHACKHWGYTRQLGPERETLVGMINPIEQREKLVVWKGTPCHTDPWSTVWMNSHDSSSWIWWVVGPPLWKIGKSIGMMIPNIWENKTYSKPPTRNCFARDCCPY